MRTIPEHVVMCRGTVRAVVLAVSEAEGPSLSLTVSQVYPMDSARRVSEAAPQMDVGAAQAHPTSTSAVTVHRVSASRSLWHLRRWYRMLAVKLRSVARIS